MLQVDRTGMNVTVVEQKEKKDYTFQSNIMDLVIDCIEKGVVPNPEVLFFWVSCELYKIVSVPH